MTAIINRRRVKKKWNNRAMGDDVRISCVSAPYFLMKLGSSGSEQSRKIRTQSGNRIKTAPNI